MSGSSILLVIAGYFLVLIIVSYFTSGKGDNDAFFKGNKNSPWYVVAFGMIGASLSGVTFISVPGWVENSQFSYMQMVLGYFAGYLVVSKVLLPLYYRLNLTSIYTYLNERFGWRSYKTGSSFFILSRIVGASFRLYLVAMVFHDFIFPQLNLNIPFPLIVILTVGLIWLYTNRGGIKTVIWTDTLQTTFMLIAVVMTIIGVMNHLDLNFASMITEVKESDYSQIFFFDDFLGDKKHFIKQFLGGMFITIAMTGLDQDMMQKNLTCRNLKEAQRNMNWFSVVLIGVNLVFLTLGALLHMYAAKNEIAARGDELFPSIAFDPSMGAAITFFFVLGLIASAYSSADSALTSLTTSFTIDILGKPKNSISQIDSIHPSEDEPVSKKTRKMVHIGMSIVLIFVIIGFNLIEEKSIISKLFQIAGYTYGPLLGLYAFGLYTRIRLDDKLVPIMAIIAPIITYFLNMALIDYVGYKMGFELLLVNGLITFGLLLLARERVDETRIKN